MMELLRRQGTTRMLITMSFVELKQAQDFVLSQAIQAYYIVIPGGLVVWCT